MEVSSYYDLQAIIHNHDRMSSTTRILHPATWDYFTSRLPDCISRSPKVVREAIMTDVNNLVQEFWSTSNDGAVWLFGTSFFPMRRLFGVLQKCLGILEVRSSIISVFSDCRRLLLMKIYRQQTGAIPPSRTLTKPNSETSLR